MAKLTKAQRLCARICKMTGMGKLLREHTEAWNMLAGLELSNPSFVRRNDNNNIVLRVGKYAKEMLRGGAIVYISRPDMCAYTPKYPEVYGDDLERYGTQNNLIDYTFVTCNGLKILSSGEYIGNYVNKVVSIRRDQIKYADKLDENLAMSALDIIYDDCMDEQFNIIPAKAEKWLISNSRKFSGRMRFIALKRGNNRCCFCGRTAAETTLEVDHIIPWSKGGATSIMNSRVVCQECNKGVYHAEQKHADAPMISR